ncbi:MAG: Holliday junction resolvase RuvX [Patescibacteria group bacterium]|nr:Holliday junction resolvase RuvX [Patescibacteria group bacterium]MDD5490213.1 Holliday junction resolvase RuvX [Patescibacteria group bacterium]
MPQILAIDYGSKRIGLALADEGVKIATPFKTLANEGWQKNLENLKKIISGEDVASLVVGLPLSLSGGESEQTRETRHFFDLLQGAVAAPVFLEDERLSSRQVDALIRKFGKKVDRDAVAAMLILQSFLDKKR